MLHTGKMTTDQSRAEPCNDCIDLASGSRSTARPHEYQVFTRQAQATGIRSYKCLVCSTELSCEPNGNLLRWK